MRLTAPPYCWKTMRDLGEGALAKVHGGLDRVLRDLLEEVGLPVVVQADREERVTGGLQLRVRNRTHLVGDGRAETPERLQHALALLHRSGVADGDGEDRVTVGRGQEKGVSAQLVRG
jgi:hypothetical protein